MSRPYVKETNVRFSRVARRLYSSPVTGKDYKVPRTAYNLHVQEGLTRFWSEARVFDSKIAKIALAKDFDKVLPTKHSRRQPLEGKMTVVRDGAIHRPLRPGFIRAVVGDQIGFNVVKFYSPEGHDLQTMSICGHWLEKLGFTPKTTSKARRLPRYECQVKFTPGIADANEK